MKGIPCKNPDHPKGCDRYTMIMLEENATQSVWACQACKDILKVVSAQVRTKPAYQRHIREQLAREGRLITERPFIRPTPYRRKA